MNKPLIIKVNGVGPVLIEHSRRAKRVSISVKAFQRVRVTVPLRVSFGKALEFVHLKKKFKLVTKPAPLSPEQLAEREAERLKIEQVEKKENARIEKLKGKKILEGGAASPGLAIGRVINVLEQVPELMAQIESGDVIVADKLRAEHDMYMKKAVAYITNTGGVTSSVSIMAREWDKPAITGTMGKGEAATQVLKTGQKVVVDGTEGAVYECVKIRSTKTRKG